MGDKRSRLHILASVLFLVVIFFLVQIFTSRPLRADDPQPHYYCDNHVMGYFHADTGKFTDSGHPGGTDDFHIGCWTLSLGMV